jgi:hypothetical protein
VPESQTRLGLERFIHDARGLVHREIEADYQVRKRMERITAALSDLIGRQLVSSSWDDLVISNRLNCEAT